MCTQKKHSQLHHKAAVMLQIAQRHFSAHAFVNIAISLDVQETASEEHSCIMTSMLCCRLLSVTSMRTPL